MVYPRFCGERVLRERPRISFICPGRSAIGRDLSDFLIFGRIGQIGFGGNLQGPALDGQ